MAQFFVRLGQLLILLVILAIGVTIGSWVQFQISARLRNGGPPPPRVTFPSSPPPPPPPPASPPQAPREWVIQ